MSGARQKKAARTGRPSVQPERYTLDDFIKEECQRSPEFAAELDKLRLSRRETERKAR